MSTPAPASFRRRFAALCYEALLLAAVTCVAFIQLFHFSQFYHFPSKL